MSTATPIPTDADQRSGSRRSWKRIAWGVLLVLLLTATAFAASVHMRAARYKANEVYQMALAATQESQILAERLGEPIYDNTWVPGGRMDIEGDGDRGVVTFAFEVAGPNDKADILAQGRMFDGEWSLNVLQAILFDGTREDLLAERRKRQNTAAPDSGEGERVINMPPPTYIDLPEIIIEPPSPPEGVTRIGDQ